MDTMQIEYRLLKYIVVIISPSSRHRPVHGELFRLTPDMIPDYPGQAGLFHVHATDDEGYTFLERVTLHDAPA